MNHHRRFNVVFFVVLSIVVSNGLVVNVNEQSNDVHLQPPNLSGNNRDNRPPFRLLENLDERQVDNQLIIDPNGVYPCNGSFLKTNGTTCGLREIMIGRCYEYQYIKRGLYLSNTTKIKNCTELYELFETAARHRSYCTMNMSTYENYFTRALEGVHVINRAMFWSGTYAIAHTYSGHGYNYVTLEDTLAAAMADGLSWCGIENDTHGFDYVSCPSGCKDNLWADMAFWGLASQTFAQRVGGEIYVILNGSRTDGRPAFRNSSYFATFELPNLQRTGQYRVTKINALVLHTPDHNVVERCGEKSILLMENLIRSYQFEYLCKDNPDELLLIMCSDAWNARECQVAREVLRKQWDQKVYGTSSAYSHSISMELLIFFIFIWRLSRSNIKE